MLKPEQVPMKVVEAYVKAYESYPPKSRQECIAAAINAWLGAKVHRSWDGSISRLNLPLTDTSLQNLQRTPKENTDE